MNMAISLYFYFIFLCFSFVFLYVYILLISDFMHSVRNYEIIYITELKSRAYLTHIILSAKLNYVSVLVCIKFAIRYHERR